jgi:hypothetical protein
LCRALHGRRGTDNAGLRGFDHYDAADGERRHGSDDETSGAHGRSFGIGTHCGTLVSAGHKTVVVLLELP